MKDGCSIDYVGGEFGLVPKRHLILVFGLQIVKEDGKHAC